MNTFIIVCAAVTLICAVVSLYYLSRAALYVGSTIALTPMLILCVTSLLLFGFHLIFRAFPIWPFHLAIACFSVTASVHYFLRYKQSQADPRGDV